MRQIKLLSLLLSLILMLSVFAGCKDILTPDDENSAELSDSSAESSNDTAIEEFLDIVKDGVAVDIVYPADAYNYEIKAANSIATTIIGISGVTILPKEESIKHDPNKVEIVVGRTSYPESQKVFATLGYNEGIICVEGNKLIIVGHGEDIYTSLTTKVIITLNSGKDADKNIKLSKNYNISISDNELIAELPMSDTLTPAYTKDAGNGSYILAFKRAKDTDVSAYLGKLSANGYRKYTSNEIDSNLFYTYTNDENVVTVTYTDYNDEMKVIIESLKNTALVPLESKGAGAKVSSTITQIGLFHNETSPVNGMSYAIRLEDGSFIVIDGGHEGQKDADLLYDVMKKQSPDPDNIVIAAWFFTHGHGDHTGFFQYFCKTYATKVTVECFVANLPSMSEVSDAFQSVTAGNLSKYFKEVPVIKAHPGQVFNLRNAKITMLYTNDFWEYDQATLSTSNEASLVFTVELEDTKFIVLGDYYDDRGVLRKLYTAETLKSDIMQVSHHGISNCGTLLYPVIAPEWALWPLGSDYVEEYDRVISEHQINAYLKTLDKNKVFMAEDNIVVLTLKNGNITSELFDTADAYLAS